MCEFCEELKNEGYAELASATNDLGILGKMETSMMCCDNENGSFVLQSMISGIFDRVDEAVSEINYCPMCGRKLV